MYHIDKYFGVKGDRSLMTEMGKRNMCTAFFLSLNVQQPTVQSIELLLGNLTCE